MTILQDACCNIHADEEEDNEVEEEEEEEEEVVVEEEEEEEQEEEEEEEEEEGKISNVDRVPVLNDPPASTPLSASSMA